MEMSPRMKQIHELVVELIVKLVDDITLQLKYYGLYLERMKELFTMKSLLQRSFLDKLVSALSLKKCLTLGLKTKAYIKNLMELRKLLWVLINFDCVTFYNYLTVLITTLEKRFSISSTKF